MKSTVWTRRVGGGLSTTTNKRHLRRIVPVILLLVGIVVVREGLLVILGSRHVGRYVRAVTLCEQLVAEFAHQTLPLPDYIKADLESDQRSNIGTLLREYEL